MLQSFGEGSSGIHLQPLGESLRPRFGVLENAAQGRENYEIESCKRKLTGLTSRQNGDFLKIALKKLKCLAVQCILITFVKIKFKK